MKSDTKSVSFRKSSCNSIQWNNLTSMFAYLNKIISNHGHQKELIIVQQKKMVMFMKKRIEFEQSE